MRHAIGCWKYVLVRHTISGHGTDCLNVRRNLRAFKRSQTNREGKKKLRNKRKHEVNERMLNDTLSDKAAGDELVRCRS